MEDREEEKEVYGVEFGKVIFIFGSIMTICFIDNAILTLAFILFIEIFIYTIVGY